MGTVLVTGGTGFIGRHTARSLADAGEQVVVTYRRSFQEPKLFSDVTGPKVKAVRCDALDIPELQRVIRNNDIDSVVHFTHISNYEGSIYQAMQTNVMGLVDLLEVAASAFVKKVTYISSIGATSSPEGSTGAEEELVNIVSPPTGVVTPSKKVGEILSLFYGATFDIPVIIARPGGVSYGPYSESQLDHTRILRPILEGVLAGQPVHLPEINGDDQLRLVDVRDTAAGITVVHRAPSNKYRLYCIGGGKPTSWNEIVAILKELIPGSTVNFGRNAEPARVNAMPDELRIEKEFGFKPQYELKEGLRDYIEWYKGGKL
jgi:nucleoside-diphosphate-sugar epimerase